LALIDVGHDVFMETYSTRYCLAVCSVHNFMQAARRCKFAQPSLSNGIRKLERELGGALFVRNGDGISLTSFGRAVRPHFEQIDKRIERIRKISSSFAPASQPFGSHYFCLVVRNWPRLFRHLRDHSFPIGMPEPPTSCSTFQPIVVTARRRPTTHQPPRGSARTLALKPMETQP
jgi:hypothetical protein